MKKTAFFAAILSVVVALVLIAGCTPSGPNSANLYNYHTGSQGIEMSFLPGNPPATTYSSNPMTINVEVKNLGAYDLARSNVCLFLSGYDQSMITFAQSTMFTGGFGGGIGTTTSESFNLGQCPYSFDSGMQQLPGKSVISPTGGVDTAQWTSSETKFSADEYKPIFQVTSCYRYMTEASLPVCIDPNPYLSVNQPKVCTVKDIAGGSQGAPVAVSKVEEDISPATINTGSGSAIRTGTTVYFRVYVNNVGAGQVLAPDWDAMNLNPTIINFNTLPSGFSSNWVQSKYNYAMPNSLYDCAIGKLSFKDYDKVYIQAFLGSGTSTTPGLELTCNPEIISLTNKQGSSLCKAVLQPNSAYDTETAYTSQLNVFLRYGYTKSIVKQVTIKNTARLTGNNNLY